MSKTFTGDPKLRAELLSMTTEQIRERWAEDQREKRDRGEEHYTALRDVYTDKIVKTI